MQNTGMALRRACLALFWAALFVAAAASVIAESLTFTVVGIDGKECERPILKALRRVSGATDVRLDWKTGVGSVEVGEGFDRESVRKAMREIGFEAAFPGEARRDLEPLPEEVRQTLDIASASGSEKIEIEKLLVPGKVTLVDYWASWCGPCHLLDLRLQRVVQSNPRLAVRRVNVAQFDNAAGKQAVRQFGMRAIPYVRVYDASGKFVGHDTGGRWEKILELVEKASAGG
jgi:thiol-disulfide isomerase/thioredoxin